MGTMRNTPNRFFVGKANDISDECMEKIKEEIGGGGSGTNVIEIDFNGGNTKAISAEEKSILIDDKNTILYLKNYRNQNYYLYKSKISTSGEFTFIDGINRIDVFNSGLSNTDWYGGYDTYCKTTLIINNNLLSLSNNTSKIDFISYSLDRQKFDTIYNINTQNANLDTPAKFLEFMSSSEIIDLWLANQIKLMYVVETWDESDPDNRERTSQQYYELIVNYDPITNLMVMYYFDNTGTRQVVDPTLLDETHYIYFGIHFQLHQLPLD